MLLLNSFSLEVHERLFIELIVLIKAALRMKFNVSRNNYLFL